jgi:hypothetical protein
MARNTQQAPAFQGLSASPAVANPATSIGTGQNPSEPVGASSSPQLTPQNAPTDPRLAAVIDAWDGLPEAIWAAIVAMVAASKS